MSEFFARLANRQGRGPERSSHRTAAVLAAVTALLLIGPARAGDQFGVASVYYPWDAGGRIAANGEVIDHKALTAAHRTLPLGEYVRVINRENGKKAILRINDRGPYIDGRVIDLTAGAAHALGVDGLADVEVGLAPCLFAERFSAALWVDRNSPRLGCPKKQ